MSHVSNATFVKVFDSITGKTAAEKADLARRRREDFDFMVLCAHKNTMGTYHLLRDRSLDERK